MDTDDEREKKKKKKEDLDQNFFEMVLEMTEKANKDQRKNKPFYLDDFNFKIKPPHPDDPKWIKGFDIKEKPIEMETLPTIPFSSPKPPERKKKTSIVQSNVQKEDDDDEIIEDHENVESPSKGNSILLFCRPHSAKVDFTCNFPKRLTLGRKYELVILCPSRNDHHLVISHPSLKLNSISIKNKKYSKGIRMASLTVKIEKNNFVGYDYFSFSKKDRHTVFSLHENIGNEDELRFYTRKFIVTKEEGKVESNFWNIYKSSGASIRDYYLGSPLPMKLIQKPTFSLKEVQGEKFKQEEFKAPQLQRERKNVQHNTRPVKELKIKREPRNQCEQPIHELKFFQAIPIFRAIQAPIFQYNPTGIYESFEDPNVNGYQIIHRRRIRPNYPPIPPMPYNMHQGNHVFFEREKKEMRNTPQKPKKRRKKR